MASTGILTEMERMDVMYSFRMFHVALSQHYDTHRHY